MNLYQSIVCFNYILCVCYCVTHLNYCLEERQAGGPNMPEGSSLKGQRIIHQ
jgi:hypothetical protein